MFLARLLRLTSLPDFYMDIMKHEQYPGNPHLERKRGDDIGDEAEILLEEDRTRKELEKAQKKTRKAEREVQTLEQRLEMLSAKKRALAVLRTLADDEESCRYAMSRLSELASQGKLTTASRRQSS